MHGEGPPSARAREFHSGKEDINSDGSDPPITLHHSITTRSS